MSPNHQLKTISASEPSVLLLPSDAVTADTSLFLSLLWQTWVTRDDFEEHLHRRGEEETFPLCGNKFSSHNWVFMRHHMFGRGPWRPSAWHSNKSFRFQPRRRKMKNTAVWAPSWCHRAVIFFRYHRTQTHLFLPSDDQLRQNQSIFCSYTSLIIRLTTFLSKLEPEVWDTIQPLQARDPETVVKPVYSELLSTKVWIIYIYSYKRSPQSAAVSSQQIP